ncbi:MAG: hypothetical protein PWP34_1747 [Desulfuromonadales bacterium]|jgi:DNA-directed RNA polymerase subunit RPC12/RpoP|nr:hypothetical protein [Desulfuromonadales bacterium]
MNGKVNVECPYCGYVITVAVAELVPGMWCECLKCQRKYRFTHQDIQHLLEVVRQKKRTTE